MHQSSRLDFLRWVIGKLFCNRNIPIQILDKNFKVAIKLKERKACLVTINI